MADEELIRQLRVGGGSETLWIVLEDGFSVAGSLADADGAWDEGLVDLIRKIIHDFLDNLAGKKRAPVIHRHDDAFEGEAGIGSGIANLIKDPDDFRKAFEAEPLALERDKDFIGGGESGGHQDTKGRWSVENAEFEQIVRLEALEDAAEAGEVVIGAGEFDFNASEIHFGRDERKIPAARGDDFGTDVRITQEDGVDAGLWRSLDAKAAGAIRLGIQIHEKNALAAEGEGVGEIERGGGFSDSPFLVCYSDDFHGSGRWRFQRIFKPQTSRPGIWG